MSLSAKLQMRQSQSLVITPQLMQAIRLLQMSSFELEQFLDTELQQNPLLERGGETTADSEAPAVSETLAEDGIVALRELDAEPADVSPHDSGSDTLSDALPESFSSLSSGASRLPAPEGGSGEFDNWAEEQESLTAALERRIETTFRDAGDRLIASHLLSELDPAGYLTTTTEVVATTLGTNVGHVERVLLRCQTFEPTGIFARDLAECLSLQLAEKNRLDPAMQTLCANLPLLASGNFAALRLVCGVDADDIRDMIAEIRALDPKPGLAFSHEFAPTVVPDILVRKARDGSWLVELNEETLPRILVSRSYHAKVCGKLPDGAERRFLSECLQKASWLEKSLDQRARTILKVASEIVRQQEEFLLHGVSRLKPLNLRAIADAIGVHESTVSRATAQKYMATSRGVFELKFFFSSSVPATDGGEGHSAEAVKHRIRQLIAAEHNEAVLSDDGIVALLDRDGIDIARRTVAKYREMMGIASSVQRRRDKRRALAS
ncbi:RNA polymerase, sigma 54 subunit, RpoN/SigL [Faunimonas pinastri]|uniref:RNA polymerase sigma-54 factor n=1 Tax=Faunimonas pinastri TaxID=1855383 RepID=A0A1H9ITS5_9HYPH|nr:RNA polymerase factor sigma-54 [Faunimonas pinastri]SEQ77993.1 RNA polymerase, sigma 54 subunit, RpoN/SigL [Faunimonas pinastri]